VLRLLGVDRSGTEYACVENLGIFAGPTDARSIGVMKTWDINAVRIPLNEDCWLGINGAPARYSGSNYRAAIAGYVARLNRAALYVILDLHWNAPGRAYADSQQPMADLDHAPSFWASVAETFKNDRGVMFDLYNEPYGVSWECWRDGCVLPGGWRTAGMQALVNVIRSSGDRQPIILTGIGWGNSLSSWLQNRPDDPAKQLVAGVHVYGWLNCATIECWHTSIAPVAQRVPVVTTELGEGGCSSTFIARYMRWADSNGVSYLGWSWNPSGCAAPSLIRSWEGQPTALGKTLRANLIWLRQKRSQ
jgi:endoglucanase